MGPDHILLPAAKPRRAATALIAAAVLLTGSAVAHQPPAALAAQCEGDECQGPPPAPEETIPGTAVAEGPANPPVRFPGSHQPKKHHKKHHRKGARHRGNR